MSSFTYLYCCTLVTYREDLNAGRPGRRCRQYEEDCEGWLLVLVFTTNTTKVLLKITQSAMSEVSHGVILYRSTGTADHVYPFLAIPSSDLQPRLN